jgi:hypothetical protein
MRIKENHVLVLNGAYILLAWAAVALVDVGNVLALRDRLEQPLWAHLFSNGRPTEWVQWYSLGAAMLMAVFASGRCAAAVGGRVSGHAAFWVIMSVALALMMIGDAGELRQEVMEYVRLLGAPSMVGIVELSYFVALGCIPLYALARYGRHLLVYPRVVVFVLLGFGFYGVAAASNATRNWGGGWYGIVGARIQESLDMVIVAGQSAQESGQWFVDALLEETLELFGATFLLAAALSYLRSASRDQRHGLQPHSPA